MFVTKQYSDNLIGSVGNNETVTVTDYATLILYGVDTANKLVRGSATVSLAVMVQYDMTMYDILLPDGNGGAVYAIRVTRSKNAYTFTISKPTLINHLLIYGHK